jgi:hypothetical protein
MKARAYKPQSKNQEHLTPDRVFELIENYWNWKKSDFFDPCVVGTPFRAPCFFNALYSEWSDLNYVNPPYEIRTLEKFVSKAIKETEKMRISIMLLPCKTDQDWFHDLLLKNNYEIKFIRKRLKFKNNKHHATDSHFLVLIK